MLIMKFGGSVLKDIAGFQSMLSIVQAYKNEKILIVISALDISTRILSKALIIASQGLLEQAQELILQLIEKHRVLAETLFGDSKGYDSYIELLDIHQKRLCKILLGVSITKEISGRVQDLFISHGELLALECVHHYIKSHSIQHSLIDARELIITDNTFGSARPYREFTKKHVQDKLLPLFNDYNILMTHGFIASDEQGNTTTMGTESSNLTASLLGSLLPASEIIIWTDIEGIRNSDPKHIADTISIRYLSYQQAERLANQGLKVIHVSMLEDPSKSGIPVTIRSAFNPNGEFTTITHQENTSLQIMINISHNDQKYFVLPDHLHHKNSTQLLIIQSSNPFIKEALIHRMSNHYSPDISCAISYYKDVHLVWGNKDYIDTLQMNLFNEFLQEESIQ